MFIHTILSDEACDNFQAFHIRLYFLDTGIPHPASTVFISSIGIPVLFYSFSFIYQHQIFSLQRREVPDAFSTFHFSLRYQTSSEPPQLHIHQNLTTYTTLYPPIPQSTGIHQKRSYKLRHHRLEQTHRVGHFWRAITLISWKLWTTTIPPEGIVCGTGEIIITSSRSVQIDPWQEIRTYCENVQRKYFNTVADMQKILIYMGHQ